MFELRILSFLWEVWLPSTSVSVYVYYLYVYLLEKRNLFLESEESEWNFITLILQLAINQLNLLLFWPVQRTLGYPLGTTAMRLLLFIHTWHDVLAGGI